jgi:hypothetical protein
MFLESPVSRKIDDRIHASPERTFQLALAIVSPLCGSILITTQFPRLTPVG